MDMKNEKPNDPIMLKGNRIISIDILRGIGIMVILVIHRLHYHWTGMRTTETLREHFSGIWAPVIIFTIALFTMAGIFYFISGIVNAFTMYSRINSGKSSLNKAVAGGVISGVWIFIMNYIQRIFFMNGFLPGEGGDDAKFPVGLATGFIRNPRETTFSWTQVTEPGTLSLIGLTIVFVSLLLGLLLRNPEKKKNLHLNTWLIIASALTLGLSPFAKFYLRPVFDNCCEAGQYLHAICVGHVCREFGLLPYLGYGFIGALIGVGMAIKENRTQFSRRNSFIALTLIIAGLLLLILFDRNDPFGRGCIGSGICFIELGLFILLLKWLLSIFDFPDDEKFINRKLKSAAIRRFGMLALTVYILEPFVAEILKTIVDKLLGNGWNDELYAVLLFGFGCLLFWYFVLQQWEKVRFAGSLEWLTGLVMLKLAGKHSGKVNFENL